MREFFILLPFYVLRPPQSGGTRRGLIALSAVDEVMHRAARGVIFQIFAEELHVALAGVAERHVARDVRREQEILGLAQRMIRRQRFGHDDIERRTGEVPGIQRFDQRVLVDGRAAANVDDISAFREQRHAVCVQDVHRVAHRGGET